MKQREDFLDAWFHQRELSKTDVCALFGISRQTGYKWARRWKAERSSNEKSRRPKHSPSATPLKLVRLILSQKRQYPFWGPMPIRKRLQTLWPKRDWPSVSTIGAILKRNTP